MDVWNISVHAPSNGIDITKNVYITANAPNFANKKECDIWRQRVCKYVYNRRKSMDHAAAKRAGYTIVYVPEGVIESDDPIDAVDDGFEEEKVLFIIKRPDAFDDPKLMEVFADFEVPGHYTILVVHDFSALTRVELAEAPLDVVPDALRMFGWFLMFVLAFCACVSVIKTNPNSMLGLY